MLVLGDGIILGGRRRFGDGLGFKSGLDLKGPKSSPSCIVNGALGLLSVKMISLEGSIV